MIGDKLVITDYHRQAAAAAKAYHENNPIETPFAVSVSGESGCGKSETAQCLAELFEKAGAKVIVLGQDDYFKLPPKSNHNKRMEDISWVGTGEVRLDLLDEHIVKLKAGVEGGLTKPLVYFEEDRIGEQTVDGGPYDVVIAEGTYTATLESLDMRVFINRNFRQTKKARLTRGRDPDVQFLEKVLQIEHEIISQHKSRANVIIDPPAEELEL